jgi:hypothetical protein
VPEVCGDQAEAVCESPGEGSPDREGDGQIHSPDKVLFVVVIATLNSKDEISRKITWRRRSAN